MAAPARSAAPGSPQPPPGLSRPRAAAPLRAAPLPAGGRVGLSLPFSEAGAEPGRTRTSPATCGRGRARAGAGESLSLWLAARLGAAGRGGRAAPSARRAAGGERPPVPGQREARRACAAAAIRLAKGEAPAGMGQRGERAPCLLPLLLLLLLLLGEPRGAGRGPGQGCARPQVAGRAGQARRRSAREGGRARRRAVLFSGGRLPPAGVSGRSCPHAAAGEVSEGGRPGPPGTTRWKPGPAAQVRRAEVGEQGGAQVKAVLAAGSWRLAGGRRGAMRSSPAAGARPQGHPPASAPPGSRVRGSELLTACPRTPPSNAFLRAEQYLLT